MLYDKYDDVVSEYSYSRLVSGIVNTSCILYCLVQVLLYYNYCISLNINHNIYINIDQKVIRLLFESDIQ